MATSLRRPTPESLLELRTPTGIAPSADGTTAAFALHASVAERGRSVPSDLWLLGSEDRVTPLTSGGWADAAPVWSPDGSRLAFVSDRDAPGHARPFTVVPGEDPVLAATFRGSAEHASWSADGGRLLVQVADPGSYALDWTARPVTGAGPDPDPVVRRPGGAWRRLFLVDLATGAVEEAGPAGWSVWEVDWDGGDIAVAIASTDPTASGWHRPTLVALDLTARSASVLYRPTWQLEGLALSPDARRAVVIEGYSSDPDLLSGSAKVFDLTAGEVTDPWPDLETIGVAAWCDETSLWYASCERIGTSCGRLELDGRRKEVWRGDAFVGPDVTKPACTVAGGGAVILTTHQAHGVAPELARFDHATGSWIRLTGFNDDLTRDTVFPDVRAITWRAPDGLEIDGLLMTPSGTERPLPLLTLVHGGPTWCWNAYFSVSEPNAVLLADAGYAVLLPNPRGSIGRGHAFAQAVIGDPGGKDLDDVLAGIDRCIADGVADPDRLGISGLSYGGYMAGWAITQTDRFGASVAHSVISNWISFHLTADIGAFDEIVMPDAWDDPKGLYVERSPVYHASRCTTPTLVTQGALDMCTPVGQAEELYRAIAATGTDVELVVYPREGHLPYEREHALDQIVRTQAWFDRYLRDGATGGDRA
ncbi:MAG TPA: S9 family peptidase [Actinomycetota bacterium]|nr:S9 family peptidase [Actinomycetota bacterium]